MILQPFLVYCFHTQFHFSFSTIMNFISILSNMNMFIIATVVKMKSFNHILNFAALVKLAKDNDKSVGQ